MQYLTPHAGLLQDAAFLPPAEPETWAGIVALEPILADIAEEAAFIGQSRGRRRTSDLRRLKRSFSRFVGWSARDPLLASSSVYEIVYRTILSAFENGGAE